MELRKYNEDTPQYNFYKEMHKNQTLEFVENQREKYSIMNNKKMTMNAALKLLDTFIDPSDPDVDVPNSIHAYQTAESIRKRYPEDKQLQITGLIHDLGKVLFQYDEPNWGVVGDTYPLGCKFSDKIVYYDTLKDNIEFDKYDKLGIYTHGCGIDNLLLSYGHDEYLYQVLIRNTNHKLEEKYLDIIRYHSFYPWHTEGEYSHFMNKKDEDTLKNVLEFNKFDLYSKEDDILIDKHVKSYYEDILNEYFFGELSW